MDTEITLQDIINTSTKPQKRRGRKPRVESAPSLPPVYNIYTITNVSNYDNNNTILFVLGDYDNAMELYDNATPPDVGYTIELSRWFNYSGYETLRSKTAHIDVRENNIE